LEETASTKSPRINPHAEGPKAVVASLKLALDMIPFQDVGEDINPPSYRMPTRLRKLRIEQSRVSVLALFKLIYKVTEGGSKPWVTRDLLEFK
jgi:hypothetical protein